MTHPDFDVHDLCLDILPIVADVGSYIKQQLAGFTMEQVSIKDFNSLVSYVDIEAERRLVSELTRLLPIAGFVTEEQTTNREPNSHNLYWIIDPLDGTTNFIHKLPFFSTSVALRWRDDYLLGVVYDIMHAHMYYAVSGKGAWMNDQALHVSPASTLSSCVIATGFPYNVFDHMEAYLQLFRIFFQQSRGVRRFGSAALDLAYVARGSFGAFFEYGLHEWDIAAGICIVNEAGGRVTDFHGGHHLGAQTILASNGLVHDAMLGYIQESLS